jgi:serine/threonine-protein kinase RsbW
MFETTPDSPTLSGGEQRAFPARMTVLDEILAFVAAFGNRHGLADRAVMHLQLVVEELFTNTVTHGYGKECDEPIEITLAREGGHVRIVYQDAAKPYDPLSSLSESRARLDGPIDERPVGQLGVTLVAGLVNDFRYAREEGRNQLHLLLAPAA